MELIRAIVLGIVQGLTEFLPVSSTGHIVIVNRLFHASGVGFVKLDVFLHAGTLAALLLYFWKDWVDLIKSAVHGIAKGKLFINSKAKLFWLIIIGTIPGGLAGKLLEKKIDKFAETNKGILTIAIALTIMAFVLYLADRKTTHKRSEDSLNIWDGIIIGIAQAVALIPGVSRSGSTISTGLFLNLKREDSVRFTFLLSVPIILGGFILEELELHKIHQSLLGGKTELVGFLTAAVVGYFCIKYFLAYIRRKNFTPFVIYRIALAIVVLILLHTVFK